MIVGTGDIASVIADRPGAVFFASGVSNSRIEADQVDQFKREKDLLEQVHSDHADKCLFYFSSISINFISSPYTRHKLEMEMYVKTLFNFHVILRLGNIDWGNNPNTFINYIRDRKAKGLSVDIRDEYKYMIDRETLRTLCSFLPVKDRIELTVATKIAKVRELI